jgi:ATP-dependent DNA helicase RecQ
MHPNALQVDPKIVLQDKKFYLDSEAAENAFEEMEETEIDTMHERFVIARGGKIPQPGEVSAPKTTRQRTQAESTFVQTKQLLKEGKTIAEICKARSLVESTVWSHIEKLATDGDITLSDVEHLEPEEGWGLIRSEVDEAIAEHGTERLKALYEATDEKYDYAIIRLARVEYLLEGSSVEAVF